MRTGRQSKLTSALQTAIVQAVSLGLPLSSAASMAGVSNATVLEWIARGEQRHQRPATRPYAEFAEAIAQARAKDEARRVLRINQAGQGGAVVFRRTQESVNSAGEVTRRVIEERHAPPDWAADAWHLERSRPDTWGPRAKLDLRVSIEKAAALVAQEMGVSVEEILLEAQALLKEIDRGDDPQ